MQFKSIIGQNKLINNLIAGYHDNRLAHTQLYIGSEGYGALPIAIAFAQYINCTDKQDGDSCGTCPSCIKFQKYAHPDLSFFYPSTTTSTVTTKPSSLQLIDKWREYILKCNGYATQNGWYKHLGVGNKQGMIRVVDASDIIHSTNFKAYESGYKIVIIWMADKMNLETSNKLLKTLEEPPEKTIIMLTSDNYDTLLATVRSRAQLFKVHKISDEDIAKKLISEGQNEDQAHIIALQASGNWNLAQELVQDYESTQENFISFRKWLRLCFQPKDFKELFAFNQQLSKLGREKQKSFLSYGLTVVHNSILKNNSANNLIKKVNEELDFTEKFAPFINSANRNKIYEELNNSIYFIERNVNSNILFTDLSLKIVDLLTSGKNHLKSAQ